MQAGQPSQLLPARSAHRCAWHTLCGWLCGASAFTPTRSCTLCTSACTLCTSPAHTRSFPLAPQARQCGQAYGAILITISPYNCISQARPASPLATAPRRQAPPAAWCWALRTGACSSCSQTPQPCQLPRSCRPRPPSWQLPALWSRITASVWRAVMGACSHSSRAGWPGGASSWRRRLWAW